MNAKERDDLQRRVRKLAALALNNPNPAEANAARNKAALLLRRLNAEPAPPPPPAANPFGGGWSNKPLRDD